MKIIGIVTEANEDVATGHLMESIELARGLAERGYRVQLHVNDTMQEELKERISCPFVMYPRNAEAGKEAILQSLADMKAGAAVFNLRCIEDATLKWIQSRYFGKIICIDELGHRNLSCDIIINPMIDPYYWEYGDSTAVLHAGSEYLALPSKLREYHEMEKKIRSDIQTVCVSMGGVDIVGTTLKLSKWLPRIFSNAHIDLIVGGGFPYEQQLRKIIKGKKCISFHRNIDYIYELFFQTDLAFCAGGNTLHELACIGTPTIVVPSRPHEMRNGKSFERLGFGICLPMPEALTMEHVIEGIRKFASKDVRQKHSKDGKKAVHGNGVEEIVKIIEYAFL